MIEDNRLRIVSQDVEELDPGGYHVYDGATGVLIFIQEYGDVVVCETTTNQEVLSTIFMEAQHEASQCFVSDTVDQEVRCLDTQSLAYAGTAV